MLWFIFYTFWRLLGWLLWPVFQFHPRLRRKPAIPEPGSIWIHGSSLGEHQAIKALTKNIKHPIWATYSSLRSTPSNAFPAPLDVPWIIDPWLKWARPKALILIETEFWPGWLEGCRRNNIPVYVLNYHTSKSSTRWKKWGLWKPLIEGTVLLSQEAYGDLKTAAPSLKSAFTLPQPCLIAASTREGDENLILEAVSTITKKPFILIAPRHLHRVTHIVDLLTKKQIRFALKSTWDGSSIDVLILDTHGELAALYSQDCIVFVGGTFSAKIGGHSPAEANRFNRAIIAGPNRTNNPVAWKESMLFPCKNPTDLPREIGKALAHSAKVEIVNKSTDIASNYLSQIPLNNSIPQETKLRPYLFAGETIWKAIGSKMPSYQPQKQDWKIPVISVGGLGAGGTGKTPVCKYLAKNISGSVVISRGYKRPRGSEIRQTSDLGDELEMLHRQGIPVISSPSRHKGIEKAINQGAKYIILDDAFQHRAVHRHIDIVCIDCRWPTSRGVIPTGWAREPWKNLERSDWIWLHNYRSDLPLPTLPHNRIIYSWMKPKGWIYKGESIALNKWNGVPKLICGIARPQGFFQQIHNLNIPINEWKILRDHSPLPSGIEEWMCTEKDAARLPESFPIWALECELITKNTEPLIKEIKQCCG
jgi:3-deoxy-D-manno-octulosonic-acid transferase